MYGSVRCCVGLVLSLTKDDVAGRAAVNRVLVGRLHGVVRPFILRRLKKEVEKEMPGKFEHVVRCRSVWLSLSAASLSLSLAPSLPLSPVGSLSLSLYVFVRSA